MQRYTAPEIKSIFFLFFYTAKIFRTHSFANKFVFFLNKKVRFFFFFFLKKTAQIFHTRSFTKQFVFFKQNIRFFVVVIFANKG